MSNFATLKAAVQSVIKTNGNQEITGAILQSTLLSIIDSIGADYLFAGVATPQTDAGSPDQNVFWIGGKGTYTNFGSSYTVNKGELGIFSYNGTWTRTKITIVSIEDSLTSPDQDKALSANMGKKLQDEKLGIVEQTLTDEQKAQALENLGISGVDDYPEEDSTDLLTSGGAYKAIAFREEDSPHDDADVQCYFVDNNNVAFAILYKDGSLKKLALTQDEKYYKELLDKISSTSPHNDVNVIKYFTDENGVCFGHIEKDGTVVFEKVRIVKLENNDNNSLSEENVASVISLLGVGADNIEMSNNPKMFGLLNNLFTEKNIEINGNNKNKVNLSPCISLIDDDTVDNQIPDSKGEVEPTSNSGGYFSLLLPFTLSLKSKHNKPVLAGLACEGHRVGLTTLKEANDNYSSLNVNGNAVKWLHDNMGWNVFNHSMTAQLPQRAYYVDGIGSTLADTILANGTYDSQLSFWNTIVLDRLTGKWYEVNSTKTAWVERTPTKKYAMPFYKDYNTGAWYFNRAFDFDYSWGEWNKRADALGLPYEKVIVHNGGTASPYMVSAGRKYAYFSIRTNGNYNYPPIAATVNRSTTATGTGYNTWDDSWVESRKALIDDCKASNTWVVFMSHFSDQEYHRNYYLSGREYPTTDPDNTGLRAKDDNYPSEWIVPLKYEEIMDIIGDNVHDYINNPPSRLNISSWSDWHPAGGTQLAAYYYVLDYAMSLGIDIVTPMEGWNTHGNVLNIGVDRNGQTYSYDSASNQTPYTDEEKSYLTIGVDASIRYYNSKQ